MVKRNRKLTRADVLAVRMWWQKRERAWRAYCDLPNVREMSEHLDINPRALRLIAQGLSYKEIT